MDTWDTVHAFFCILSVLMKEDSRGDAEDAEGTERSRMFTRRCGGRGGDGEEQDAHAETRRTRRERRRAGCSRGDAEGTERSRMLTRRTRRVSILFTEEDSQRV